MAQASLTGKTPFPSFTVPGVSPSVVIGREPTEIDGDALAALKKGLKDGLIPGLTADDVLIEAEPTKKKGGK